MNLPNKLTVLRVILVPVFMLFLCVPLGLSDTLVRVIAAVLFALTSLTDMLDGKIARKYNMITDFGKLMDPLADKFMVIGALTVIVFRARFETTCLFYTLILLIVVFRELGVSALRLVASSSSGAVVAANMLGKIKTVMQIIFISTGFIEPALYAIPALGKILPVWWVQNVPLSYLTGGLTLLFTVWSGINYFIGMWKYLDPAK